MAFSKFNVNWLLSAVFVPTVFIKPLSVSIFTVWSLSTNVTLLSRILSALKVDAVDNARVFKPLINMKRIFFFIIMLHAFVYNTVNQFNRMKAFFNEKPFNVV